MSKASQQGHETQASSINRSGNRLSQSTGEHKEEAPSGSAEGCLVSAWLVQSCSAAAARFRLAFPQHTVALPTLRTPHGGDSDLSAWPSHVEEELNYSYACTTCKSITDLWLTNNPKPNCQQEWKADCSLKDLPS